MGITEIIDSVDSRQKTLTVLNREDPEPVVSLMHRVFDDDSVAIRQAETTDVAPANVVLVEDEDGTAIAASTLDDVRDELLMVNADLYITGTRSLSEVQTPEVVANLDDVTFTVRNKSKFLLIQISRHIEAMALETERGTLHSGFQELSRITAERGTKTAYRELLDTDLDVHVYGMADWDDPIDPRLHVHAGDTAELRTGWFVVFDGDGDDWRKAALVAEERAFGTNEYRGFWTFDPEVVDDVCAYLEAAYLERP